MHGYLAKIRNAVIRIRIEKPDYSDLLKFDYDWTRMVFGETEEYTCKDTSEPLEKEVVLTHFVDANLMHCMATRKSVTGILHMRNKTPIDWYSKKQGAVCKAIYGSEYVAAATFVEQICELRTVLRYLGVPIFG